MLVRITEHHQTEEGDFVVDLLLKGENFEKTFQIEVENPHTLKAETQLSWYFEDYIQEPYSASSKVNKTVNKYIYNYGIGLFNDLFGQEEISEIFYNKGINNEDNPDSDKFGYDNLEIEIVSNSLEFQSILWESMRESRRKDAPLAARNVRFYRKSIKTPLVKARVKSHPHINLLIVVARPSEENDVNYRTIQRPLIELSKTPNVNVNPYILRPGTYKALEKHLEAVGPGFYHIVHFDVHGEVLEFKDLKRKKKLGKVSYSYANTFGHTPQTYQIRWGRYELEPFEGKKAFLFLESDEKGVSEPSSAEEIATLLVNKQIPVCILNACQSAKQDGKTNETSLGKFLLDNGMDLVLAMRYIVSVSAAIKLMEQLYHRLFQNRSLEAAIASGRSILFKEKERNAHLGRTVHLEDWLLPIVYKRKDIRFNLRTPTEEEKQEKRNKKKRQSFTPPPYGFWGRDLDILKIEKLLLPPSNHLLLRGMTGVGKSALLKYLAGWWLETNFRSAKQYIYFDFRDKPLSHSKFVNHIGQRILKKEVWSNIKFIPLEDKREDVLEELNKTPFVIFLDNLFKFDNEQIIDFLSRIQGASFVVYGSVNEETQLGPRTFVRNTYTLRGLDKESTFRLSKTIIDSETNKKIEDLTSEDNKFEFETLLKLLAGFPSVLMMVLPHLKHKSVHTVLDEFRKGTLDLNI